MIKRIFGGVAAIALTAGLSQTAWSSSADGEAASGAAAPITKPALGSFGFDATGMNKAAAPGDDFYAYANGQWDAKTEIPADRSSWGASAVLRDLSDQRTRTIIEDAAAASGAPGSNGQKVGDYFAAFMDEAAIEAKGVRPVAPMLAAIAAIKTPADMSRLFGEYNRIGFTVPLDIDIDQDLKDNSVYAVYLGQSGLGMPDRDYYLSDKPKLVEARARYKAHVARLLELAGVSDASDATARAERIYDLEHRIAEAHWSAVESRQIEKLHNPLATGAFASTYPGVDWAAFFKAAGVDAQKQIVVTQPSAVTGIAKLVGSVPVATWKDYLTFHTIANAAPLLGKAMVEESFAFNGTVLKGTPQNKERWKLGVDGVNGALGEAVGQLYVARYFPPEAKAKADELVRNLIAAMDVRLSKLEWMAPETRVKARAKLAAFTAKIGYPDKWRDYSALTVRRDDAFGNAMRAQRFEYQRNLDKLGKPVDRSEWYMTPQMVNAYANPLMNEIAFPAAILQPPFFDPNADPAVNYGGIGAVIGHEITHHFDDQGSKFDPQGNMVEWWTPQDVERFKRYTEKVVTQFNDYEPLKGTHINGELTLGENMADLAGLNIAYDAYQRALGGKPAPMIDGYSGDQRFFLGWAQVWRSKYREPFLQQLLTTDPHSPGNYRAYMVRNMDKWYKAFNVKPGQKLYLSPEQRLGVW